MPDCLIGLGANLADREAAIERAIELLAADPEIRLVARSELHPTRPVGGPSDQPEFLNAAVRIETSLDAAALFERLRQIESMLGRRRDVRWEPRTIDLDLLLYGRESIDTPRLQVPHPRMAFRRFVLQPAAEVAADMLHPPTGWTIARLLEQLDDSPRYIALAGAPGVGKTQLARRLAATMPIRLAEDPVCDEMLAAWYADPTGLAWETESRFLDRRSELLDRAAWPADRSWTVTDFWLDQSLCFAAADMDEAKYRRFETRWRSRRDHAVAPRLIVLLDAPTEVLLDRIEQRGRDYERRLDGALIDAIRRRLVERTAQPDTGPVLRLDATASLATLAAEVAAAIAAMDEPPPPG